VNPTAVFHPRVFVLQTEGHVQRLRAVIDAAWEEHAAAGKPLEVVVSEWKARRNTGQNRYYWRRLQQASDQVWIAGRRFSPEAWHEEVKGRFIGYEDLPSGKQRALSSGSLSVEEFSEYTTKIEAWFAEEHGVIFQDKEMIA
jgi:hypothetical protein